MLFKQFKTILTAAALALPLFAQAGPYSSMFVFGDSLSDTGNLSNITGGAFPGTAQPYAPGRFSDGAVWVETLAARLGLASDATAITSGTGGKNYAFAGARTGVDPSPPGVLAQVAGLWGAGVGLPGLTSHAFADPNALYIVVGGGNDMRDARSAVGGDHASRVAAAGAAVTNLRNSVLYLASRGAKNILISNLPDLGFTPEAILLGLAAQSSDATNAFNALIGSLLSIEGFFPGLDIDLLDMAGITAQARVNPAAFGVTNTISPCAGFTFSTGASCATSLFSDVLHPSALGHRLIAGEALAALGIPEPDSLALFGLAFVALAWARRQRRITV